jgi:hypothetical protein
VTKKISSITTYFISIFLFGFLLLPTITNAADPLPSLKNVGQGTIDPLPPLPPIQNQTTPNEEKEASGEDTLSGDLPPLPDLANTAGTKASSNFPTSPGAAGTGGFFDSSPNNNSPSNTLSATTRVCNNGTCQYQMLAPIPGLLGDPSGKYIVTQDSKSLCSLLNQWFRIGIALAGMLAVVMIVLGGFQYATTDSLFDKSEGKEKIQSALWGLILALTTWLVLSTINPALTKCEIVAKVTNLQKIEPTLSESLAGAWSSVKSAAGNTLKSIEIANKQSIIDAAYNRVLDQWTEEDRAALNGDDAAAKKAAEDKWASIQSELDDLGIKYASQIADRNATAGPANQRVLDTISSGYTCKSQKGTNCYLEAVKAGDAASVNYNTSYQSPDYVVNGRPIGKNIGGDARMPLPGEMVDMYTNAGYVYTDPSIAQVDDPYHSVIVTSIDPTTGKALVWDWGQGLTRSGLRSVTFNTTNPNTKEYIGRIYKPSSK